MLQVIGRLLRPAPPPVVETAPAPRPLYEGLTSAQYSQLLLSRVDARQAEEADMRRAWRQADEARARIQAMRAATEERETIRSSRWVTDTKKEK